MRKSEMMVVLETLFVSEDGRVTAHAEVLDDLVRCGLIKQIDGRKGKNKSWKLTDLSIRILASGIDNVALSDDKNHVLVHRDKKWLLPSEAGVEVAAELIEKLQEKETEDDGVVDDGAAEKRALRKTVRKLLRPRIAVVEKKVLCVVLPPLPDVAERSMSAENRDDVYDAVLAHYFNQAEITFGFEMPGVVPLLIKYAPLFAAVYDRAYETAYGSDEEEEER